MTKKISAMGNTVVPALLALEELGFTITGAPDQCTAARGDEVYAADDPVTVLGLVKLVETRSWNWRASDADIENVLSRYRLNG